ncbi:MAG: PglZ domain-containing protein [Candidatus Eisenbacteria bacterium]|uniref:PglZ domain-containing protein n=1 Tax=Eiseniibacteriota bacterium TaxID=2212470 RepID=A0A7Y2EF84_UNCEI|nr:PglZ domain-containing protein [Candidatus Eisenbacteria bacterium]
MSEAKKQVLWADDEIDLLRPHILYLEGRGYEVTAVPNGEDALSLFKEKNFDVVLLDEMMPGLGGIETLRAIKEIDAACPVVLITKSEEESLMEEAIGKRIQDYLVKPVHPSQVLLTVKRLTEGTRIQEGQFTRDYVSEFNRLQQKRMDPLDEKEWRELYQKVSDLELELYNIEDSGLRQAHFDMKREMNRDFSRFLEKEYPKWIANPETRPTLSTDIVPRFVLPNLKEGHTVYLIVMDCMRYDQWLSIQEYLDPLFRSEVHLYYSVMPSATPYSRNAIFSGLTPKEMAEQYPKWWGENTNEERGRNRHETEFLEAQLARHGHKDMNFKYQKVYHPDEEAAVKRQITTYEGIPLVTFVFNFLDLLTHGRSESRVLRELAPDEAGFRSLLNSWFSHSVLREIMKSMAEQNATVILTTDHGAVQARRSSLVYGNRETSTNLRHKHGVNLRGEDKDAILIRDPETWGLPNDFLNKNYILAREDFYFVYPTNFHEYERLYRNSFQHGGAAMEEVILPCVVLNPR